MTGWLICMEGTPACQALLLGYLGREGPLWHVPMNMCEAGEPIVLMTKEKISRYVLSGRSSPGFIVSSVSVLLHCFYLARLFTFSA